MKAYTRPEATAVRLFAADVVASSATPDYIQMGEVSNAGAPTAKDWNGLSDGAGF